MSKHVQQDKSNGYEAGYHGPSDGSQPEADVAWGRRSRPDWTFNPGLSGGAI